MLQICRKILKQQKGQSLVELALILPLLLLFLLGVVEFGRLFHTYLITTQGSREGARLAVVGGSDAAIIQRVEQVTASLDKTNLTVNVSPGGKERIRGIPVEVKVNYEMKLIVPNMFNILPDPFIISSTTTMRME